jgi:hypothetical protein
MIRVSPKVGKQKGRIKRLVRYLIVVSYEIRIGTRRTIAASILKAAEGT